MGFYLSIHVSSRPQYAAVVIPNKIIQMKSCLKKILLFTYNLEAEELFQLLVQQVR